MKTDSPWDRLRISVSMWFWRLLPSFRGKRRLWQFIVPREGWFPTVIGIRLRLNPMDYTSRRLILGDPGNDLVADFAQSTVRGGCFLDIGSNRGPYAAVAGRAVGVDGIVIAVEPNPLLWKPLLENLAVHVPGRYVLLPMAIADEPGWMGFSVESEFHTGGGHLSADAGDHAQEKLVAVQTASAVIDPLVPGDAPEVRVKIDTEGAELLVLKGLESLLRRSSCRSVLVELAEGPLARFNSTETQVYEFMSMLGFQPRIPAERAEATRNRDGYYDQWFEKPGSE